MDTNQVIKSLFIEFIMFSQSEKKIINFDILHFDHFVRSRGHSRIDLT